MGLQLVEGGGPLGSGLAGAISIVGTDVNTLPVSSGERQSCREGSKYSETHD
jgi:hypothetical protein